MSTRICLCPPLGSTHQEHRGDSCPMRDTLSSNHTPHTFSMLDLRYNYLHSFIKYCPTVHKYCPTVHKSAVVQHLHRREVVQSTQHTANCMHDITTASVVSTTTCTRLLCEPSHMCHAVAMPCTCNGDVRIAHKYVHVDVGVAEVCSAFQVGYPNRILQLVFSTVHTYSTCSIYSTYSIQYIHYTVHTVYSTYSTYSIYSIYSTYRIQYIHYTVHTVYTVYSTYSIYSTTVEDNLQMTNKSFKISSTPNGCFPQRIPATVGDLSFTAEVCPV